MKRDDGIKLFCECNVFIAEFIYYGILLCGMIIMIVVIIVIVVIIIIKIKVCGGVIIRGDEVC